ncbi:hypothetical protein T552_02637 [Pneumocystis carinii B80]|uniref:Transcription factor CBF/NF-Y/archaeal histone domain-containing protein n=1 Tax=Pneumocystis carinii (strain B80) TaxID=1408658 RepID=A0A0W4ZE13_PNEC8|nr:hypothetical protein T552_02637 [Pneumocystis carinii B80]KTW26628.1 hypothetical protein T552_02637 [Pneumocystis carinii B80]
MTKPYPRRTLKTILKAHIPHRRLAKNLDVLVYLDYLLFISTLVRTATLEARQMNEKTLRVAHLDKTIQLSLDKFRG